ncbi:MAG: hypothetical protein EXS05_23215 [Planctomycetaceae bacterium]|nr:hypothetical protein [Planctomycetaceae bacterium]
MHNLTCGFSRGGSLPIAVLLSCILLLGHALLKADDKAKADKPAAKTKAVKAGELTLRVPETWKQKPQVTEPRVAQFAIPPAGDDKDPGEYAVFYFGEQGAGGVQANIERWVNQFEEKGREIRTVTGECPEGKYTLVELSGAYNKSVGPPIQRQTKRMPGWKVYNVMLETKSGHYFLKLDGPAKTIAAVEDEFRASFGAKKDDEKEQKAE